MAHIRLENINLTFFVKQDTGFTLKDFLVGGFFRKHYKPPMQVQALDNLNLEVHDGQKLGVIGHNGAGKSTLLKMMAGIYKPTSGIRDVNGRISSLFDIALGFEQEATGWENIRFRCYLQGETPASVRSKQNEIAEFSDLGEFLEMPVRFYSAGMRVRLAFSIATAINPEILLIDEVLSAGDLAFQAKAHERMRDMIARARLMVMVSHDLDSTARLCDRIAWLEHGKIRQVGPAAEMVKAYREWSHNPGGKGKNKTGGTVTTAA
ncbi:MAG: ABC transporter ATP-binding protein [Planctomycetota bacterium]